MSRDITKWQNGIRPVWSESSLTAWRTLGSLATHWVHSEDSDQTGRMSRLVWVFAGRTLILLVLSCRGSYNTMHILRCNKVGKRREKMHTAYVKEIRHYRKLKITTSPLVYETLGRQGSDFCLPYRWALFFSVFAFVVEVSVRKKAVLDLERWRLMLFWYKS